MNISSLYLDHSVFSGHTWNRAVDGESNTEVKVGCSDFIILSDCDNEPQPAVKTFQTGHHTIPSRRHLWSMYVVKLTHLSRNAPPSGRKQARLVLPVSASDCFGNSTAPGPSRTKNQIRRAAPAYFHVSQAKCKSPACLSELIPTHLKQMELPNLNGYVLFFHISAGKFVRRSLQRS